MLITRLKGGLLGLLATLLVTLMSATAAYAEPGPFCHHREVGKTEDQGRITEKAPELFQGEGGQQVLTSAGIELVSPQVQIKGIIYNNEDQCQVKIEVKYHEVTWTGHKCTVTVGTDNSVKLFGHLAWKWDGSPKQLEEQPQLNQVPDWIFLPKELKTQTEFKELPKEQFTTVSFKGGAGATECAALVGAKAPVVGSVAGQIIKPEGNGLEKWSTTEEINLPPSNEGKFLQHIWNGFAKGFTGVETGLKFNGEVAKLVGGFTVKAAKQEIAHFEKA